jgi:hypothetical protein
VKRVLVVIAILVAAIAGWVFLGSGATAPRPVASAPAAPEPSPAPRAEPAPPAAPAATPAPVPAPAPGHAATPERAGAPRRRAIATAVPAATPADVRSPAAEPPRRPSALASASAAESAAAIAAAEAALGAEVPDRGGLSGAISGAVLDAAGAPLAGATILALAPDGSDGTETFTDDDGEFLLPGLRPGPYAVFTGLGTQLAARVGGRAVSVGSARVTRVELREPADAAPVRVAAVDAAGRAVEGETLLLAGHPGDHGAFRSVLASAAIYLPELGGRRSDLRVPPGTYTVVVLQGAGMPARAARDPIHVTGPLSVSVQLGDPR